MLIITNTVHGIFTYTIYNLVIESTINTPIVESFVHQLLSYSIFILI